MSDNVLRFSTTASCGSILIPNWSSRNVTTLSTAMESRIPVVMSGVVSVRATGSSPGRYSLRMNVFTVLLISCGFIKNSRLGAPTGGSSNSLRLCLLFARRTKQQRHQTFVQLVCEQPVTECRGVIVPFGEDQ